MPMRRKSMQKIREIIRLKEANFGERAISRTLKVSRPTVKQYINQIADAGLDFAAIEEMDDDTLQKIIDGKSKTRSPRLEYLSSLFEYFVKELKRPGVTLQRLWEEYISDHPDGYGYSQFCYHFQQWRDTRKLTMHMDHKAGDKMFVDFTGKHLSIVNRQTGEEKDVEIFVAVLGASQRTYVEATLTQKKEDWIKVNQNALLYFGGVPHAIVPDCLKTGVTNGNKYEPDINPEYMDFARHYQTVILPARPNSPKDKALVEGAVRIVYAWIFASLRNRIFHTLEELNSAIWEELKKYNSKPMQVLKVSRIQLFNETEKNELKPLPKEKYVIRHFRRSKAQFNYHAFLSDDKHYYSFPHRYRGQQLVMIYTDTVVELFCKNQRIAFHKRDRTSNGYTTIKEHMPPNHRFVSEWNPTRFINWAQNIGGYVKLVIEQILEQKQHPEQAYKVCLGILNLEKIFSRDRLNKACQRAIHFHHYSYKGIKNILERHLEDCQMDCFPQLPEHQNIRGTHYYQ
jgi:transposase